MQSKTVDFVPGAAATWRTGRNIRVVYDSGLFGPLYENMTPSTKPEVHKKSTVSALWTIFVVLQSARHIPYDLRLQYLVQLSGRTKTAAHCGDVIGILISSAVRYEGR